MFFKPEDFQNADGEWINPMHAHLIANEILKHRLPPPLEYVPIALLQQMERHKNESEALVRQLEADLDRLKKHPIWKENCV